MRGLILLFTLLLVPLSAQENTLETTGKISAIAVPLSAFLTTLYLKDKDGTWEFSKAYTLTLLSTSTLKYAVDKERPNKIDKNSFPSRHTASAFSGASFIHLRYGFKYAIIPYIAAIYTGYSRVATDQHYIEDVIVGAIIGSVSSMYFTSKYKNTSIKPLSRNGYQGIQVSYRW